MNRRDKDNLIKVLVSWLAIVLLFAIAHLLAIGCSPKILPARVEHRSDTIVKVQVVHDTVNFTIPVEKEVILTKDTTSLLENTYARSKAEVSNGFLSHSLETKAHTVYVPVVHEVHDTTIVTRQAETIIQEVEREFSKWESFSMVLGWVLGGILLLFIIFNLLRRFLR